MRILNKLTRNFQDYGLAATVNKAVRYLVKPIYFRETYRIYGTKVSPEAKLPNIRRLTALDGPLVRQIKHENEFLGILVDSDKIISLVALADDNSLMGFILIDTKTARMPLVSRVIDLSYGDQAYIEHVGVSRDYRGAGLGHDLMLAAIGELHERGFDDVYCGVLPANKPSVRMIDSAGFMHVADVQYRKFFTKEEWNDAYRIASQA